MRTGNNRWLLPVLLNSGFLQGAVYIVRPMMTYKAVELGASSTVVGIVGATFALAPLLFAIRIGQWIDRNNSGRALLAGTLISFSATVSLIFIEQIWLLMAAIPLLGIGHLLVMSGGQTMTGNRSEDVQYERNFGLLTFYASIGHALGPLIGGAIADRGGTTLDIDSALMFAAGLFLLAAITVFSLREDRADRRSRRDVETRGNARAVFALPGFKSAIFVSGSITSVIDVMLVFLPLLGRELGFSATEVGVLLAVRAVSSMLVRILLGPMSRRFGMRWTLNFGSLTTVLAAILIAVTTNFWLLLVLMFVAGFSTGIGQPATMAWVSRVAPPDVRGLAISIRLTSNRLGQVVIPAIAGSLASTGVGTIFWLLAALQGASFVVSERSLGGHDPQQQEGQTT